MNNKLSPSKKILERILVEGNFLFLLDGYDEIYSKFKEKITNDIDEFIDRYNRNYFLITSRPGANIESLERFDCLYVENLTQQEIEEFVRIQLLQTDNPELADKIIEAIDKEGYESFEDYLGIPVLLSMFILTFEHHPILPRSKSKFYWNVFDTLSTRHDSITKRGGYQHERKTNLQAEEIELILKWFSYHSFIEGKFSFDRQYLVTRLQKIKTKLNYKCNIDDLIDDLTVSISIIIIDGLDYKFPHRSMQEYFTALLIKDLPKEIKPEVYGEKTPAQAHQFDDSNFWSLCLELDKNDFLQYYLLRKIKDYHDGILKTDTDTELILSYCRSTVFGTRFAYDPIKKKVLRLEEWWRGSEINEICDFCGLKNRIYLKEKEIENSFDELKPEIVKPAGQNFSRIIRDLDQKVIEVYEIDYYDNNSSEKSLLFAKVIAKTDYPKRIRKVLSDLKTFILKKEEEIEKEKKRTLSLLL